MIDRKTRSLLCVPAHRPAIYEKAARTSADVLMFDLEDSVPPQHKAEALAALAEYLATRGRGLRQTIAVRVNPWTADLATLVASAARLDVAVLPKVRHRADLERTGVSDRNEPPLLLVVETPQAIVNLRGLVKQPKVHGCIFGMADFAAGMGVSDRLHAAPYNSRFAYAKQKLATYCAAYGKACLDTSFRVKGERAADMVKYDWSLSRSWGYTGGAAIHPMQVDIANTVFGPGRGELAWSEGVTDGHESRDGEVGVDGDGLVVGLPVVRQAEAILRKGERE